MNVTYEGGRITAARPLKRKEKGTPTGDRIEWDGEKLNVRVAYEKQRTKKDPEHQKARKTDGCICAAAAAAVSIAIHAYYYAFTRFNYALIIARSRTRREVDREAAARFSTD